MGRRRRFKGKKHHPPDPVDVLQGRIEIGVAELFDLIHRVNPTGRKLPAAEETRRYALKARLQSLLIRRFGDRHVLVKPGEQDGIVSLSHRSGSRDACHAVLAELETDSRSWAQHQLDVEASPDGDDQGPSAPGATWPSSSAGPVMEDQATTDELLRRGRQALEDYDYEAAERHLWLALEQSGGGAAAARALLELLVGLLGMDRQALEIEPRLAAGAMADAGVRELLALAAARRGDAERALELAAGTAGPATAEVHAVLAAQAIRERDPETAGLRLDAAAEHDPTHPRLPSLGNELAALRAENQRPAEEALERRARQEGFLAAEDDARALLDNWPRSEVARRILRQVAAHRRTEEIHRHLEQGERALAEERFHQAAAELQAALDAGSERTDLPALIERARARERQQRETARLDAAVDHFASSDLKHALMHYLSLAEALRRQVRARVDRPILDWLEETAAPKARAKAQAAVSAVLALERAVGKLRAGRPGAALDELAAHQPALGGVAEARRCLRQARSQVANRRRAHARETLETAGAAWKEERIERVQELLDGLELEALAAGEQAVAEELRADVRRWQNLRRLERELEHHVESEDYLGGLERADQLVREVTDPDERQRWRCRAGELRDRLRTVWRLEITGGEAPLSELRDFRLDALENMPRYWLDDQGRELVLAAAWSDQLFIRVVDIERGRVVSRVSMKTPEPLESPLDVCFDGDRLWVAGARGGLLELEAGSWDVLSWRSLREFLPAEGTLEEVILLPGGQFLWLRVQLSYDSWQIRVVDLKAWRVSRKLPEPSAVLPVAGPQAPAVVVSGFEHGARLHAARGTSDSTKPLLGGVYVHSAAISPDGDGLVLVADKPFEEGDPTPEWPKTDDEWLDPRWKDDDPRRIMLALVDESEPDGIGLDAGIAPDDGVFVDGANAIVTSLDESLSYALIQYGETERELLILDAHERTLEVVQQEAVPFETVLVQDRRSRYVTALMDGESFFDVVPLGSGRPRVLAVPEPRERLDRILPFIDEVSFCGRPTGASNAHVLALLGWWRDMPAAEIKRYIERQAKKHAGDPDELVHLCLTLGRRDDLETERQRLIRDLALRYPRHGGAALLAAGLEAEAGHWQGVARLLGPANAGDLEDDDGRLCHFYHLFGLALLREGRSDEAFEAFEQGSRLERGDCMLQPLIHLTRPMSDPPEPHEHGLDQPVVRQLLGAIRLADRALAAGDPAAALAAVDRRVVWHQAEPQSAGRLAAAYLELSVSDPGERFRKRLALALFEHALQAEERKLVNVFLPGLSWDEARLTEVGRRARACLERDPSPASNHGRKRSW